MMSGEVVYFYAFDVANEIAAGRLGSVLGYRLQPLELRLKYAYPKDVAFHRPLAAEFTESQGRIGGEPLRLQLRVFAVGAVSLVLRVPFRVGGWADLHAFHEPRLDDGRTLDDYARRQLAAICADLAPAMVRPSAGAEPEAYTVFCLADPPCDGDLARWLTHERAAVAGLLSDLPAERLSDAQIAEVHRYTLSLEKSDVVVIDWDAALICDLTGWSDDLLYVLEIANLQLEEFKVMDQLLDGALDRAYIDLDRHALSLFRTPSRMLRKLRWLRVDITRLTEEVTNITKFVGDWYLARVYLAARERFHLDRWRQSVEHRLGQLDQLYSVVHSEAFERRMLFLEFLIVVFFAIDLIGLFWFRK